MAKLFYLAFEWGGVVYIEHTLCHLREFNWWKQFWRLSNYIFLILGLVRNRTRPRQPSRLWIAFFDWDIYFLVISRLNYILRRAILELNLLAWTSRARGFCWLSTNCIINGFEVSKFPFTFFNNSLSHVKRILLLHLWLIFVCIL